MALRSDIRYYITPLIKDNIIEVIEKYTDVTFSCDHNSEFIKKEYTVFTSVRNMTINKIRKILP